MYLKLAGIRARIRTNFPKYYRFLYQYCNGAVCDHLDGVDVDITIDWIMDPSRMKKNALYKKQINEFDSIGSGIFLKGTTLCKFEKIMNRG